MTTTTTNASDFIVKVIEYIGDDLELTSYSGRGMYGRHCVGLLCEDTHQFYRFLVFAGSIADEYGMNPDEFANIAWRSDSMGRGLVFYAPQVEFISDDDDE